MALKNIPEGITYDDIYLIPQKSNINSRHEVLLTSKLTKNISLALPIVSANMETVTESQMAIAMARQGGIGFIHRFNTIEEEVRQVSLVKREENARAEDLEKFSPETPLRDAVHLFEDNGRTCLFVVDNKGKLLGIVKKRDILFESKDSTKKLKDVMMPFERLTLGRPNLSLQEAVNIFKKYKFENLPLVDKTKKLVGLITIKDVLHRNLPNISRDKKGRLLVGAAIGIAGDYKERAAALVKAGADVLVVDVAHGHLVKTINTVKEIKRKYKIEVVAGNVATAEGARDLILAGADAIKVGVGPGSICKTRIVTGFGVPQISAIMAAATMAKKYNVPLIADGSIRTSGDIVKALAVGASTVMMGNLLAGTEESPGEIIFWNGKRCKIYRGMASLAANLKRADKKLHDEHETYYAFVSEGTDRAVIPTTGSVKELLIQMAGGVRSGFSYCGARNIKDLWRKAKFIRATAAGVKEGQIHDVQMID
jgi:IMP dehydrogenase